MSQSGRHFLQRIADTLREALHAQRGMAFGLHCDVPDRRRSEAPQRLRVGRQMTAGLYGL
jgi:hypothetical protein